MSSNGYIINDFLFNINEDFIEVDYSFNTTSNYILNESLREYLVSIKEEIGNYQQKWDIYKKYTNKYEYINSAINNGTIKYPICSYKPISRSFFKMIEILNNFDFNFEKNISSFHLAEGPGGFIEALANYRNNKTDNYYGITLMDNNSDIPKWNKISNFMKQNKNIKLLYGPKNDGNLYLNHNLLYFKENYSNKYDFITADGGFDYSIDFNKQEENSLNLIFCEVLYALILQKENGSFILKIFDIFHKVTLEILYLLCYFYEKVNIYKPLTSREANSEKYIICKKFKKKLNYNKIIDKLTKNFYDLENKKINNIFKIDLNIYYLNKIQEINAIFGQQQIENIMNTINYIKDTSTNHNEKINKIKNNNIDKCIKWCIHNNQPINKEVINNREVTNNREVINNTELINNTQLINNKQLD